MNTAEINEIRKDTIMSRDYLESANLETIYLNDVIRNLCDELEKAQAELVECHKWDGFLMAHGCFGEVDIAQIVEDDKAELEDA